MIPQGLNRIIAAGKCIDGDDIANAAFRAMGPVQCIGNAAGTAAALAVQQNTVLTNLDIRELKINLRKDGVPKI